MKKVVAALAFILLVACDKEKETVVYFYGQTSCADVWGYGENDSQTKEKLTQYLANQGIRIEKVELSPVPDNFATCLACTCPNGRSFAVTVNKADGEKLKTLGFYL